MQRVTRITAVAQMPAPPASPGAPGYFTGGDPVAGLPATVPGYEWFNTVQEEVAAVVLASLSALDRADNGQMLASLRRLFGGHVTTVAALRALTVAEAGLVLLDATAGPVTATLPLAAALAGLRYDLVRLDATANAVTIQRAGSDGIDGATSIALVGQYALRALRSGGQAAWHTVAGIPATTGRAGITRYATAAEALAGSEPAAALTPLALAGLFPAPLGGGKRVLAVKPIGSTGDSSTTSHSFSATTVVGSYTRAVAGSEIYVLALIDGQISGVYVGQDAAWRVEHWVSGTWQTAGITSVMSLWPNNLTLRSGMSCAGILDNPSTAAIDLRLAHRTVSDGVTAYTGAASSLLILELG